MAVSDRIMTVHKEEYCLYIYIYSILVSDIPTFHGGICNISIENPSYDTSLYTYIFK